MSSIQLLTEHLSADEACVMVAETVEHTDKKLWIQGIFMQADVKNHNQRVYPISEIARAINDANAKIRENNGILGELEHPSSLQIGTDRASHVITEYRMQGSDVYGKAKILDGPLGIGTPMGNIAAAILRSGVRLGVSSRGAGAVNESTGHVSDFTLITCDIVANPSAPNAYPKAVMEALEYAKNVNEVLSLSEAVMQDGDAQKYLKAEILKAVDQLVSKSLFTMRDK